jgi:hypothetical protein
MARHLGLIDGASSGAIDGASSGTGKDKIDENRMAIGNSKPDGYPWICHENMKI